MAAKISGGNNSDAVAGNIELNAQSNIILNEAEIEINTEDSIDGSSLIVYGQNMEVKGQTEIKVQAYLEANGNGGTIELIVENLLISDGSEIEVATFGEGHTGDFIIRSQNIEITGDDTEITFEVGSNKTGNGGNFNIQTDRLVVSSGAAIETETIGESDAVTINISAREIELNNAAIFAEVSSEATGKGGNITISAEEIRLVNAAQIQANTEAEGRAGNIIQEIESEFEEEEDDDDLDDGF